MKTQMLMLAMVLLGTSLVYAQSPEQISSEECKKKVMKKIKRQMNQVNFMDYIPDGSSEKVVVTCVAGEDKVIEIANIRSENEKLNSAILQRFDDRPVICEDMPAGKEIRLVLTFKHMSPER